MAVAPTKPPPLRTAPLRIPEVPLNGRVFLAEDTEIATEIAAGAEIDIPILFGVCILLGVLYSAKYLLIPLMKLAKIPGSNWFSDAVNGILGIITAPVHTFLQWVKHQINVGIESQARPITRVLHTAAFEIHDLTVAIAMLSAEIVTAFNRTRTVIIPRVVRRETLPTRQNVKLLLAVRAKLNAIAREYGYADFPTLVKTATPHIKQLVAADIYVKSQRHKSLAGALSVYEAAADSWNKTQLDVKKLGFYNIPAFIRYVQTYIEHIAKPELNKLKLRVGKIENLLKENAAGIPVLLALMAPAARAAFFRPAIPSVCTEVGECAANNLLGKANWQWLKDMLKLLLAATIDALLITDLCQIARLAQSVASDFEPALRDLAIGEGTLFSHGCGGNGHTIGPPKY